MIKVEMTLTFNLNDAFNDPRGQAITFSAKSSMPEVASAEVEGATLTITAKSVGKTEITVTATDTDGEMAQDIFAVNVEEAEPESKPGPTLNDVTGEVTLTAEMMMEDIPLPAGYTLTSDKPNVASVERKMADPGASTLWEAAVAAASTTDNVWTITAESMGKTTVHVRDADDESVKEIAVMVTVNMDPIRTVAIGPRSLHLGGEPLVITLSNHFSDPEGRIAGYDITVIDPTKVMATEDEGILTLVAKSAGKSDITVTAKDDADKEASDTFTVTVDAGCLSEKSLDVNEVYICTIPHGHHMDPDKPVVVHVGRNTLSTDNKWTITALKKGTATVFINNASSISVAQIAITVNNQKPIRKMAYTRDRQDVVVAADAANVASKLYKTHEVLGSDAIDAIPTTALSNHFEDPDNEPLKYKVESPGTVLVKTDKDGYLMIDSTGADVSTILLDLLAPTEDFNLIISAHDDVSMADATIEIRFNPVETSILLGRDYTVDQGSSGNLVPEKKIGNRLGVNHTIKFTARTVALPGASDGNADGGFVFAAKHIAELIEKAQLTSGDYEDQLVGSASIVDPRPTIGAVGDSHFAVSADRATVSGLVIGSATSGPMFNLKLSGTHDPTITITHSVWVDDKDGKGSTKTDAGWVSRPKKFVLDVVPCTTFEQCSKL